MCLCACSCACVQELKARYSPLEPSACRPLWEKAYEAAAGGKDKEGRERKPAVARKKRLHILGGAVMRSWGEVQVRASAGMWVVGKVRVCGGEAHQGSCCSSLGAATSLVSAPMKCLVNRGRLR